MIDSILDRATSILERRFLTNAFLPVLLLLPAAALPGVVQSGRTADLLGWWDPLPLGTKAFIVAGYFTAAWYLAAITASQWRNIIRLFEGYPLERWPILDEAGKRWHRERCEELENDTDPRSWDLQYHLYPASDEVLPTRLGNVLRAAERYPLYRYDAEMILIWPRLYQVLPRESMQDVEDARATLEFLLVLSLWCVGFSALAPIIAWLAGGAPVVALSCFAVGVVGAYAAYLSAIAAASEYGEYLRSLFDIHRFDLLRRLRLPVPSTIVDERHRWTELSDFLGYGTVAPWIFETGVADGADPSTDIGSRRGSEPAR